MRESLTRSFPPVTGGYSGQGQRGEYPPPMKQASVIWRLGNEGGLDMRDFQLRSNFDCFLRHNRTVHSHSFACLQIAEAFSNHNRLNFLPVFSIAIWPRHSQKGLRNWKSLISRPHSFPSLQITEQYFIGVSNLPAMPSYLEITSPTGGNDQDCKLLPWLCFNMFGFESFGQSSTIVIVTRAIVT